MNNHQRPEKLRATAFDGLAAALSPALIIGMIGSLVFFLVIAFYRGQYDARLMYILGLYTAATVLVARIAIESDRARAAAFAVPLAIAAMLGMMRFVTISGELAAFSWIVNVGLLALTWYLADRITFDCTLLEEDRESLQGGLLQTIGSSVAQASGQERQSAQAAVPVSSSKQPIGAAPLKKAKHNPGVWVLYFALIAFPLFGVGQLVIPDERQRSIAFWCLVTYLACALSLLMTTSLLGMRRYLRQRGAMMPPDITAKWLVAGGLITALLLLACMLMPLPGKQLSVAGMKFELTSPNNLSTSKFGWGNEGPSGGQPGQNPKTPEIEDDQSNSSQPNQQPDSPSQSNAAAESKPSGESDSSKGDSGKSDSGKSDSSKGDSGKSDSGKSDSGKSDSNKSDSSKSDSDSRNSDVGDSGKNKSNKYSASKNEPSKNEPSKNEPSKNEPSKNEPSKNEPSKNEPSKNEPSKNEPSKNEPTKNEPTKNEPTKNEPTKNEPSKNEPSKNEPSKNEPTKNEPTKNEPTKNEPTKNEPTKNEPTKNEPTKNEPTKNEPSKNEPSKNEPSKNEPSKNEPSKNEPTKNEPTKNEPTKNEPTKNEPTKNEPTKNEPTKNEATKNEPTKNDADRNSSAQSEPLRAGNSLSQASRSLASDLLKTFTSLAGMFKWLLIALCAAIVLFYVVTHIDEVRRLFNDLMNFIQALFGRKPSPAVEEQMSASSADAGPQRRPFSSFVNPFAKGLKGWQGPQVVQHTFTALEAWAAERGRMRPAEQTAEEFARTLLKTQPELARLPLQAANMLDRVMFANWQPTREEVAALAELWERMR